MAPKRSTSSPSGRHSPPPPVAPQSPPRPPARRNLAPALADPPRAVEGGDSGSGSGNGANSPIKSKKRVTAPPVSHPGPKKSPSSEAPALQATPDHHPKSPPKSSMKKKRNKKKEVLRAGDSAASPDGPPEPIQQAVEEDVPPKARKKPEETEEEVAAQQGGEEGRKSKRVPPDPKRTKIVDAHMSGFRRKWNGNDEMMILEALADHTRNGQTVPQEPGHPLFHDLAQHLESSTFNHTDVREKLRRLKRQYNDVVLSGTAPTKDHDRQLHKLSCQIWGHPGAHAGHNQRSHARDEQRSFDEMCKQFPLLAKEIEGLVEEQPAIMNLFPRLDGHQVVAIEKKLENLRWIDMKRKKKMAVKMAKIRKALIYKLEELRS
uniref:Glabrous enhancer-binding protein-like DBD domain-containing protein n=1 Tax=Oryza punctata TaxID=4537 RepID=A0A0E0LYD7_ORYPU